MSFKTPSPDELRVRVAVSKDVECEERDEAERGFTLRGVLSTEDDRDLMRERGTGSTGETAWDD